MSRHTRQIPRFLGIAFVALLASSGVAAAQTVGITSSHHAVYLELGGSTSVYSLNYEFQPLSNLAFRVGALSAPFSYRNASMNGGLVGVGYLFGTGRHRLELGGALTGAFVSENSSQDFFNSIRADDGFGLSISPYLGYRLQPLDSGLILRLAFTPVFSVSGPKFSQSPLKGGLSIGWRF